MHLPGPLRAAVGLVASAAEEAKHLPDRAIELPMLAVSTALQMSLRAQQRYARLAARGDAVLNRRQPTDEPPPWATFDEPVSVEELRRSPLQDVSDLGPRPGSSVLEDLFGTHEPNGGGGPTAPAKTTAKAAAKITAKATRKVAAKAPAKEPAKAPAKEPAKAPAKTGGKGVNKPRHTAPSRFDDAGD